VLFLLGVLLSLELILSTLSSTVLQLHVLSVGLLVICSHRIGLTTIKKDGVVTRRTTTPIAETESTKSRARSSCIVAIQSDDMVV
jgi:hypothetical protein